MTVRTLLSAVFVAIAFAAWPLIGRESRVSGAWMATAVMIGSALTVTMLSSSQLGGWPSSRAWWILGAAAIANGLAVFVYSSSAADPMVAAGPFIVIVSVLQVAAVALITWMRPGGQAPSLREAAGFVLAAAAVYLLTKRRTELIVELKDVVLFSTALLAIVNPLGSAVLFAAVAGKFDPRIQQRMANQSALAILVILLVCAWLGNSILGLMGLTTPMLQAAGGLILLNYGLRMVTVEDTKLTQSEQDSAQHVPEEHWKALAVVPLAIPGTVGAGTITTVIIQASTFANARDLLVISGVSLGIALLMWITFHSAGPIARRLGPIGMNIISRVMGILVTATAFGLLGRGIGGLLPGLAK